MKKPVCNFNCFECLHPDCICDDFSRKEYVTDAEINRIAGMTRSKTGLRKKNTSESIIQNAKNMPKHTRKSITRKTKRRFAKRRGNGIGRIEKDVSLACALIRRAIKRR